jgi:subtilisin family serine protease
MLKRILIAWLFFIGAAELLQAGPVNSPASFPFAKASSRGDRLTIGDQKGLVYWQEQAVDRAAAFRWQGSPGREQRFTGGLAEAKDRQNTLPAAVACSDQESFLFFPERSPEAPAGIWMDAEQKTALGPAVRRCAMTRQGHFAEFFPDQSIVRLDRLRTFALPAAWKQAELLATADEFILIHNNGQALTLFQNSERWQLSALWKHPFVGFTDDTRFEANERLILQASPNGNTLATIQRLADGSREIDKQRLPVNPCDVDQPCGLSLAHDDSWVLSGYWGHYLGRGLQFMRLNIPLSLQKGRGAVAIAHAEEGGRYVYLGWDDGDQGVLPRLPSVPMLRQVSAERWMIWQTAMTFPVLATISLPLAAGHSEARSVFLNVWSGPLPEPMPASWIAWEPAYELAFQMDTSRAAAADNRWWLDRLAAKQAFQAIAEAGIKISAVHVAVIDSGIDTNHPLLQEQLDIKPTEIPGNGRDDDGNGFVDDVWGYDFVEEDAVPQDQFGHGTHVAGLLAAKLAGDIRNASPNLRLQVVRALDQSGKSNSIDLARALFYAAENAAEIVNCSWGGGSDTQALRDAFAVLQARGILVFSSAGNDKLDTDTSPSVPKKYAGVRAVAALSENDRLASFSSYGRNSVRFLAPGEAIISTVIGGGLGEKSGTSMASPIAASSFALAWGVYRSLYPELSTAQQIAAVDQILCASADSQGVENRSQCGRIRLLDAIQQILRSSK